MTLLSTRLYSDTASLRAENATSMAWVTHHWGQKTVSDQCLPQSALVMMVGGTIGISK
jgi:hypothetical protein